MSGENEIENDIEKIFSDGESSIQQDLIDAELGVATAEDALEEVSPDEGLPTGPLEAVQIQSIIESLLIATDRPMTMAAFKEVFKGVGVKTEQIRKALESLAVQYAGAERGFTLEEVAGGFQLRTKEENRVFVRRLLKTRPFKLSGPALEVLAIIAYKQPLIKAEVDEIRGVESGHLVRALMDRGLVRFDGKSELPGKPMLYATTRKFLEIFSLRDLRELPSLSEINDIIPEGIGQEEEKEQTLSTLTTDMSLTYEHNAEQEVEFEKITEQIQGIDTSTEFFEQEKKREKERRDRERAETIRELIEDKKAVEDKDLKWLERYESAQQQLQQAIQEFEKNDPLPPVEN